MPWPAAIISPRQFEDQWANVSNEYLPLKPEKSIWRYSRHWLPEDPSQGWKIHISATILTAAEILSAIGAIVIEANILFKAPVSLEELMKINSGVIYGYSQVGKFITIYPRDEADFTRLVDSLNPLLVKWSRGPVIPFDHRFQRTCIYYRYGVFRSGEKAGKIISPDGVEIEDARYLPPSTVSWIVDPFKGNPNTSKKQKANKLNNRYVAYRVLSQRGKGGVYECLDMHQAPPKICILKEGRSNGEITWDGRDGRSRLRNETRVLKTLAAKTGSVPQVIDRFRHRENEYLVLDYIDGISLHSLIQNGRLRLTASETLDLCRQICEIVASVHSTGWLWRDCKPYNFVVNKEGIVKAIDFEGACRAANPDPLPWSTRFYTPPEYAQSNAGDFPSSNYAHDLYALGACLYQLLEGKPPIVDSGDVQKQIRRRGISKKAKDVILELLGSDPLGRPTARAAAETFGYC